VWVGALVGASALGVGILYHRAGDPGWQSMVFTSLAFLQIAQAFGTRSTVDSLTSIGWTSNRLLLAVAGLVVALQLAALHTPLRTLLELHPLGPADLGLCAGMAAALLVVLEAAKARGRTRHADVRVSEMSPAAALGRRGGR
jgi:P-type Ca2+ transporter type 2C